MAKNRIIFYSIFGAYQIAAFIFTIFLDSNDTSSLFGLLPYLAYFKYMSFIGVMLIIVDFVWSWRQTTQGKNESEKVRHENNTLKAKIYDIQETKKQVTPAASK